ncbi:hypothetical protein CMALT394_10070 [Carnobacterium maltaromaticum]|nr:hypothetical protein CMALT394_10070 [Carnobacterium maltaromaticum]
MEELTSALQLYFTQLLNYFQSLFIERTIFKFPKNSYFLKIRTYFF